MRARALALSLAVLALVILLVPATGGAFPAGAVLLSGLIAATTLEPLPAAIIGAAGAVAGILLAHFSGGYSGAELVYRSVFYVIASAFVCVLAIVRSRREHEIAERRQLDDLHAFTVSLFAETDVHGVGLVASGEGARLLDARLVRLLVRDDDHLVHVGNPDVVGVTSVSMTTPSAIVDVARDNQPLYFHSRAEFAAVYPQWVATVATGHADAIAVLPVKTDDIVLGTLVIFWDHAREFAPDDRIGLEQIAREIAIALERARLREREQAAAVKLQESLLGPPMMVEGVGHEARYLPAEAALHVGGDWYTAQRLPDGRVGIAVGDVVGRGLEAASVMGQLRSGLAAFSEVSTSPAETLTLLDNFARSLPGAPSTTVALARVDIWGRTIEYSLAGHPPPVLVTPEGDACLLEDATGRPLAVLDQGQDSRPAGARPFPPGSLVLLYSDGLVERRGESIDRGLDRLLAAVRTHWNLPLPLLCDALLADLREGRRADDLALLALRSPAVLDQLFLIKERALPDNLAHIRYTARAWLGRIDLPEIETEAIVVAIGEATTNVVEHAYRDEPGLVRVEGAMVDGEIVVTVGDTGRWHDNSERTTRGNGLPIMHALMDTVTVDRRAAGSTVTMRLRPRVSLVPA
jgi:serine phosphatase RsbU (regulator of sigma subunit)/anti-sigma regulatory factor (Ser/Thr protein kinase)